MGERRQETDAEAHRQKLQARERRDFALKERQAAWRVAWAPDAVDIWSRPKESQRQKESPDA